MDDVFVIDLGAQPADYGAQVVSLDRVKQHLRVLHDDEDELIGLLRDAAVGTVEEYAGVRMLRTPGLVWRGSSFASIGAMGLRPVHAVSAVRYGRIGGAMLTLSAGSWSVGVNGLPTATAWPTLGAGELVEVDVDAGFDAGRCPAALVSAVLMLTAHLYFNREAAGSGTVSAEVPLGFSYLLRPFRRMRL